MKHLKQCSLDELHNYDAITAPIANFVSATWEGARFSMPRNLNAAKADMCNYDEEKVQHTIDEALQAFRGGPGVTNETETLLSWEEALTAHRVANEMEIWPSTPMEILIKTVFTFGMNVADEIHRREAPPNEIVGN